MAEHPGHGRDAAPARPAHGRGDPPSRRRSCGATRTSASAGASPRSSCASRRRTSPATSAPATSPPRGGRDLLEPRGRRGLQGARRPRRDHVAAWEHQPDGQPNMTVDEFHECDETLRRDPRVVEALAGRGISDMERVLIDTWAYGAHLVPEAHRGGRVGWADVWYRDARRARARTPTRSPGCTSSSTSTRMELLEIEDERGVDEPRDDGRVRPPPGPGPRACATTSSRSSHPARGRLVHARRQRCCEWQRWSLRVGFNHREGMVLHTVGYEDDGRVGRSRTGSRSPRWSSPTATRPPTTSAAPRSTSASGASAS